MFWVFQWYLRYHISGGSLTITRGRDQQTLLHYAAAFNKTEFIDYLLSNGFDINVRDVHQATPLHIAGLLFILSQSHSTNHLLLSTASSFLSTTHINFQYSMFEMFDRFLKSMFLCVCSSMGSFTNCKISLWKRSPLQFERQWRSHSFLNGMQMESYWCCKFFLMSRFAEPNETDKFENTALHWAAHFGQFNVVSVLVKEFNADVNKPNNEGRYMIRLSLSLSHLYLRFFNYSHINAHIHSCSHKDTNLSCCQMGTSWNCEVFRSTWRYPN